MKNIHPAYLAIATSLLLAACASIRELPPKALPAPVATASAPSDTNAASNRKPMSCKGCQAATDSLKSARAAAREALLTEDKEKLKAALQKADAQMAKMEGHKEMCMSMMKESGKADSAPTASPHADGGHAKHH